MRLAGLILVLLLSGGGTSWAASQDQIPIPNARGNVAVTPLGPDEVLLELEVTGISRLPGELATVSVPVTRAGPTPAAARAALASEVDRIVAAARKAGIAAADVQVTPREDPRIGFIGIEPDLLMAAEGQTVQPRRHMATALVQITLRDQNRYERLRDSIETAETVVPAPVYSLHNPERGEREARADGLRRARVRAADCAGTIGMRVGRLVRVSAREASEQWIVVEMMRMMSPDGRSPTSVETKIAIAADFALVPNR
ncbi:MAG TPA: SIMPL domain-containing protein [Allosphingosinicella sp.]